MMSEIVTTLGEITDICTGKLDANAADKGGIYPFFTCGDDVLTINQHAFDTEAVLLAGNGNFGIKHYKGKFNAYQRTYVIEPVEVDGKWLYYLVKFHIEKITKYARGSTIKYLRIGDIENCQVSLTSLENQKRVVDKIEMLFSDLDKGEELVKQVQKQLATYRQSVLKAAVTGELTKDWRERNKHKLESGETLLERILKSRRDNWQGKGKYKESTDVDTKKFSSLPQGWVWATPDQLKSDEPNALCIGPFGSNLKVSDYTDSGVPLVFVRHIKAKQFDGLKPQFVSKEKAKELSSHRVAGGDLLITKMGEPPGDVCIYPEGRSEAIITADCIRFSSNKDLLNTEYLELAISSQVVQQQIRYITKGVAQQKVTLGNFKVIALPLPGLKEQNEIADLCRDIFSQIDAMEKWCEAGLKRSATLRQSILKDAFSGKLVPQDPADEPASELLKRIQAEQANQPKATRGRKTKKARA